MASTRSLAYQSLSDASNDIRILIIQPAQNPNDLICCHLEHVTLAASSNYIALSYCWGRPHMTVPVRINGTITFITPSLADALITLRERNYLRVWADAICINQTDMEERSRQVLRMAAIYRSASAVLARPGDADEGDVDTLLHLIAGVEKLLEFDDNYSPLMFQDTRDGQALRRKALRCIIGQVLELREGGPVVDSSFSKSKTSKGKKAWRHIRRKLIDRRWEALARLLGCEYWSRVWIIQELAMAKRLHIVWGSQSFSFGEIAFLVAAFKMLHKARLVGDVLPFNVGFHMGNLVKFQSLQRELTLVPLIKALRMASYSKATDARDKVYSLMGLTYDGAIMFPTPSYGRELDDINREATLRLVQIKNTLDHIVFRSVPPGSWVIDWFNPGTWSNSRALAYLMGETRFNTWYGSLRVWAASGSSRPCVSPKDTYLEVKGTVIDTIRGCSATYDERKLEGTLKSGCREESCSKSISIDRFHQCFSFIDGPNGIVHRRERFFAGISRALAAATPNKQLSDMVEWISCPLNASLTIGGHSLREWFELGQNRWLNWTRLRCEKELDAIYASAHVKKVLQRGMRLGETVKGRVGWFTEYARSGDKVAILAGCSVPVVLRPLMSEKRYMIVGDSIIMGRMKGMEKSTYETESIIQLN
ncbi:hypothetical protein LCI18_014028 [Fusarium solani-melongenae]|uniref:Uncharacterized protein n=1 Tax=Fusarium solani subsp. cucurbitae TaxID=2747967 RepID=A0ACD3ZPT8_FUSSC|nr:hypothetical protein LCI18_014028 [Fusarium solani-melongenae]